MKLKVRILTVEAYSNWAILSPVLHSRRPRTIGIVEKPSVGDSVLLNMLNGSMP